jgi:hypothetical protein
MPVFFFALFTQKVLANKSLVDTVEDSNPIMKMTINVFKTRSVLKQSVWFTMWHQWQKT